MVDDKTKVITFLESVPRNYPETIKIYSQTEISKTCIYKIHKKHYVFYVVIDRQEK